MATCPQGCDVPSTRSSKLDLERKLAELAQLEKTAVERTIAHNAKALRLQQQLGAKEQEAAASSSPSRGSSATSTSRCSTATCLLYTSPSPRD